jgi:hypothetical protein
MPSLLTLTTRSESPLNANTGGTANQTEQPAFVTVQSFASFSGASALITAGWKLVQGAISAGWADSRLVPAVFAVLIGIYLGWKAFEGKQLSPADSFGMVLVTVFNTAFLWAASCGIDVLGSAGLSADSGTA